MKTDTLYEAYARWFVPWQHRPCSEGSGKTCIVEGLTNKWHNRASSLVRKTVCVCSMDDQQRCLWMIIEGT